MSSTCSKSGGGDKNRFFLRGGDGQAIAGARVELHDFPGQLVLLLQNQPREVGGIFQVRDDHAFDGDAETLKHPVDEVVGERAFLRGLAQEHADDRAHLRLDVDDKNLLVVADKQRTTAVGREDSANLNWHNVVLHAFNLGRIARKTSPALSQPGGGSSTGFVRNRSLMNVR